MRNCVICLYRYWIVCIIVDINTLASVFKDNSSDHEQFKPVQRHITTMKSKLIIGGTKFQEELEENREFIKLLKIMKDRRQVVEADTSIVDSLHQRIEDAFNDPKFDDKHIVALCYVTGARLVCTKDTTLQSYLKERHFYNRRKTIPKIYNSASPATTVPTGRYFNPRCNLC